MFEYTYNMRYGDLKDFDTIKPSAILDVIQDVAIKNSDECGYTMDKMREINMAWMLQGIKVHFNEPVKAGSPLTVHTAVRNMKGITSERGTIIFQDGKPVVKAVANWFLFDGNKGRPGRIPADMAESYPMHNIEDEFFAYSKPALCEAEVMYQLRVSNKDIDTNIHLNNQKSAEMLMDALPFDFFFTDMNVYYKKAAVLGDILELCSCKTENGYYVHLQTPEKEVCVAGVFEFNK
ncbi:MAG: hypothetical protein IJN84_04555 [Clostridia bacterium]|nr:hypothetical protein [Clostridia bacterium]